MKRLKKAKLASVPRPDMPHELQPNTALIAASKRNTILRRQARTDFVVDPDGHSVRWHWEREDRMYREWVNFSTFAKWSVDDAWVTGRDRFWEEMEERVLAHAKDRALRQRIEDIERVSNLVNSFERFLHPLVDDDGKPLFDDNGLPKLGLKLPPLDRMISAWLDLQERLMELRGQALQQPVPAAGEKPALPSEHTRDSVASGVSLSREDVRYLARSFVRMRMEQPETPEGTDGGTES